MNFKRQQVLGPFIVFCLLFITAKPCYSAEPSFRVNPELMTHIKSIKIIGLLPPDIKIYEITAGGVRELRDDWSAAAKENVVKALTEMLKVKQVEVRELDTDKDMQEEMEDIQALYRAVVTSILVYTYGPRPFPEKQKNFDYAIGSIEQILNSYGVDALLFVYGVDENASGGRKALIAAGIIAGVIPRAGMTAMNMALVDKSGSILWFNVKRSEGRYDLRKTENATEFTKDILSDFPRFEK